jgi:hypothetical protein
MYGRYTRQYTLVNFFEQGLSFYINSNEEVTCGAVGGWYVRKKITPQAPVECRSLIHLLNIVDRTNTIVDVQIWHVRKNRTIRLHILDYLVSTVLEQSQERS